MSVTKTNNRLTKLIELTPDLEVIAEYKSYASAGGESKRKAISKSCKDRSIVSGSRWIAISGGKVLEHEIESYRNHLGI